MKRIVLIIFATFSVLTHFEAAAQRGQGNSGKQGHFDREAFEAKRNAYMTAELGLTPDEATQFIPLYMELREKQFELGKECRKRSREIRSRDRSKSSDLSDAECTEMIDICLEAGIKEAELVKAYYERFKKILPPKKLYRLEDAESKFMKSFMNGER